MQKVTMPRLWKSLKTMHINFLPMEKMLQVLQKGLFVTICTAFVTNGGDKMTRENFS